MFHKRNNPMLNLIYQPIINGTLKEDTVVIIKLLLERNIIKTIKLMFGLAKLRLKTCFINS